MPNHVSQDLWVRGDSVSLIEFKEFAKEDDHLLSANKFIPYPTIYAEMDKIAEDEYKKGNYIKDGFNSGGYEWVTINWGTKWGIYSCSLVIDKPGKTKGFLRYKFQSAWSPATKIIFAMSKKFPTLEFRLKYFERGQCFQGIYLVKNEMVLVM